MGIVICAPGSCSEVYTHLTTRCEKFNLHNANRDKRKTNKNKNKLRVLNK